MQRRGGAAGGGGASRSSRSSTSSWSPRPGRPGPVAPDLSDACATAGARGGARQGRQGQLSGNARIRPSLLHGLPLLSLSSSADLPQTYVLEIRFVAHYQEGELLNARVRLRDLVLDRLELLEGGVVGDVEDQDEGVSRVHECLPQRCVPGRGGREGPGPGVQGRDGEMGKEREITGTPVVRSCLLDTRWVYRVAIAHDPRALGDVEGPCGGFA